METTSTRVVVVGGNLTQSFDRLRKEQGLGHGEKDLRLEDLAV